MTKSATPQKEGKRSGAAALAVPVVASLAAVAAGWFGAGILASPAPPVAVVENQGQTPAGGTKDSPAPGDHGSDKGGHGEGGHGEGESGDAAPVATPIGEVVDLPPIVVNLAPPSTVWARLELAAVFTEAPDVEARRRLHQDILAFMETVTPAQLAGPSGLRHLREDITDIARAGSDGKAQTVLFRTLIFE